MNGTEAYSRLYPKATRDSCRSLAADLLAKVSIQALITERLEKMAMPQNELLARLSKFGRGSIRPFLNTTYDGFAYLDFNKDEVDENLDLIKKIKTKRTRRREKDGNEWQEWEDESVEVELQDQQAALEKIGRLYPDDKNIGNSIALTSLPADLLAPSYFSPYRAIRAAKYFEFLFKGGRGCLKSTFISEVFILLIESIPNIHGIALRQVAETLRDSVYSQLEWAIITLGRDEYWKRTTSPLEMEFLPTHQKIYFRGADKPEKIKSIKPAFGYIGLGWFEELDQFRGQEAVRNIEQSIFRGGDVAFNFKSYNPPPTAANWANKYALIPKENQLQHESNYLEVPPEWLGKRFLEEAEHLKLVNPRAYEHEYLGVITGTGGMVFENLDIREITDEEINGKQLPNGRREGGFDHLYRGIDWGYFPDPFSFGLMHYDAARMILYVFGEFRANKLGNRKAFDELEKKSLIDKRGLIIADSAEPKSVADFRTYGANIIGAEKGPDSVDYSMKWLQSLVKIVIDPVRCPYHAKEFMEYELEKDKDGEFISAYPDKNNHSIDDVRYAMNSMWKQRGK